MFFKSMMGDGSGPSPFVSALMPQLAASFQDFLANQQKAADKVPERDERSREYADECDYGTGDYDGYDSYKGKGEPPYYDKGKDAAKKQRSNGKRAEEGNSPRRRK